MKLITETLNESCEVLIESTETGKKNHFITGIFMQGGIKNRNGRIYPVGILENEMNRYNKDFIQTKRALGELGHPNGPQINGDRVSHIITEMKRDGNNFIGKARILSTPMGEIVKTFVNEGVQIGVSTRGLGSVKPTNEGLMEVQSDFHLATVDIVTDPSGPNCFVNGILENTEYYFDLAENSWKEAGFINKPVKETVKENIEMETALKLLEGLQSQINKLKKTHTSKKTLDESKVLNIFDAYFKTLKNNKY